MSEREAIVCPRFVLIEREAGVVQIKHTEFVTSVGRLNQLPTEDFPEVAFAGRSNVGKSSLINRLLARKSLAKTSNTPGKTRTLNFYRVNRNLHFVDLPGYGFAKRSQAERKQWASLINGYLDTSQKLVGIVQLVDARHDPSREDLDMIDYLARGKRRFLLVATKADKLTTNKLTKRLSETERIISQIADVPILPFSATTGQGRNELLDWIGDVIAD